jgi:hypothetical protein
VLHIGKGESNLKKGKLPNFDNKIKLTHLIIACLAVAVVTAVLTYVAAMLTSLLQVLRLLSILRRNDRDR